jgi:leucyl-tRNA synthetase
MRFLIELPAETNQQDTEKAVMADERSQKWLEGKTIRKFIFVPKKIINVVVS